MPEAGSGPSIREAGGVLSSCMPWGMGRNSEPGISYPSDPTHKLTHSAVLNQAQARENSISNTVSTVIDFEELR